MITGVTPPFVKCWEVECFFGHFKWQKDLLADAYPSLLVHTTRHMQESVCSAANSFLFLQGVFFCNKTISLAELPRYKAWICICNYANTCMIKIHYTLWFFQKNHHDLPRWTENEDRSLCLSSCEFKFLASSWRTAPHGKGPCWSNSWRTASHGKNSYWRCSWKTISCERTPMVEQLAT